MMMTLPSKAISLLLFSMALLYETVALLKRSSKNIGLRCMKANKIEFRNIKFASSTNAQS